MLSWRKSKEQEGSNKATSLYGYIIHVSHIQIKFITLSIIKKQTCTKVCVCVCVRACERQSTDNSEVIN